MDVNGDNAIITPDNNIYDNGGDGVEVTGNTVYIHNNEINRNGGNGIFSVGNNAILLNHGEANKLVGVMEWGNPFLLVGPNSVDGVVGSEFPPIMLIANLLGYFDKYFVVEIAYNVIEDHVITNWPD